MDASMPGKLRIIQGRPPIQTAKAAVAQEIGRIGEIPGCPGLPPR
jgi:hypothetical protein